MFPSSGRQTCAFHYAVSVYSLLKTLRTTIGLVIELTFIKSLSDTIVDYPPLTYNYHAYADPTHTITKPKGWHRYLPQPGSIHSYRVSYNLLLNVESKSFRALPLTMSKERSETGRQSSDTYLLKLLGTICYLQYVNDLLWTFLSVLHNGRLTFGIHICLGRTRSTRRGWSSRDTNTKHSNWPRGHQNRSQQQNSKSKTRQSEGTINIDYSLTGISRHKQVEISAIGCYSSLSSRKTSYN